MKQKEPTGETDEQALVRLYMELTGASETNARSVLIYVTCSDEELRAEEAPPALGWA